MCLEYDYDCEDPTRPIDEQCCAQSAGLHPVDCRKIRCDGAREPDSPCCRPDVVRPVIQERAWSSPIWFEP